MQASTTVKADILPAASDTTVRTTPTESSEPFSQELDKQISASSGKGSVEVNANELVNKAKTNDSKTETAATKDGKSLPADKAEGGKNAEKTAKSDEQGKQVETVQSKDDAKTTDINLADQKKAIWLQAETKTQVGQTEQSRQLNSELGTPENKPVQTEVKSEKHIASMLAYEQEQHEVAKKAGDKTIQVKATVANSKNGAAELPVEARAENNKPVARVNVEAEKTDRPAAIRVDILEDLSKHKNEHVSPKNKLAAQDVENKVTELSQSKSVLLAMTNNKAEKPATTLSVNTTAAVTNTTPSLNVQPTVQNANWSKVMIGRVVWMAKEGVQRAELKLTPANMGPIEVRLSIQNEQVSVSFQTHHALTREALEQALPRLRESFAESGIQLADAEVGEQTKQEQADREQDHAHTSSSIILSQVDNEEEPIEIEMEQVQDKDNILSIYA